jgi:hypothetical protein
MKNIRDLYRGIGDFRKGHRPANDIVKEEKDDMVTDWLGRGNISLPNSHFVCKDMK